MAKFREMLLDVAKKLWEEHLRIVRMQPRGLILAYEPMPIDRFPTIRNTSHSPEAIQVSREAMLGRLGALLQALGPECPSFPDLQYAGVAEDSPFQRVGEAFAYLDAYIRDLSQNLARLAWNRLSKSGISVFYGGRRKVSNVKSRDNKSRISEEKAWASTWGETRQLRLVKEHLSKLTKVSASTIQEWRMEDNWKTIKVAGERNMVLVKKSDVLRSLRKRKLITQTTNQTE